VARPLADSRRTRKENLVDIGAVAGQRGDAPAGSFREGHPRRARAAERGHDDSRSTPRSYRVPDQTRTAGIGPRRTICPTPPPLAYSRAVHRDHTTRMLAGLAVGATLGILAHAFLGDAPALTAIIRYITEPAGAIFLRLLMML